MKVSIITISYNSAETIEDTIQSVLAQDYTNIEYIVVDGASSDGTVAIIDRYRDKISQVISEKDKGIYDAMNKGVALATGDVVGILNSDDVYAATTIISDVVKEFNSSKATALYGDLVYVKKDNLATTVRYWQSKAYSKENFLKGWMPPHPAFFLKKDMYNKFGVYNTQFKISADYELMLRMLYKHDVSVTYLPKVLTKMRVGGESNKGIGSRIKANKEDRLAWKINGLNPRTFTFIRKPLSKLVQFTKKDKS